MCFYADTQTHMDTCQYLCVPHACTDTDAGGTQECTHAHGHSGACPQGVGQESGLDWALCSLPPQLPSDSSPGLLIKARTEGTEARGGEEREGKFILVPTRHAASLGVTHFLGLGQAEAGEYKLDGEGRPSFPSCPSGAFWNGTSFGKITQFPPPPHPFLSHYHCSCTPSRLWSLQLASPLQHTPIRACRSWLICVYTQLLSPHPPTDHPTQVWYIVNALRASGIQLG